MTVTTPPPPPCRRTGSALPLSIGIHGLALLLLLLNWRWWPLALAMIIVNHLLVAGAGLWPRSTLLGPNLRRL